MHDQRSGQGRLRRPYVRAESLRARRTNEMWYPTHGDQHAHGLTAERRNQRTRLLKPSPVPVFCHYGVVESKTAVSIRRGQEHYLYACKRAARSTS
jgi:hypothetical protein